MTKIKMSAYSTFLIMWWCLIKILLKVIVGVLCFVLTLNSCIYNAQAAEDKFLFIVVYNVKKGVKTVDMLRIINLKISTKYKKML